MPVPLFWLVAKKYLYASERLWLLSISHFLEIVSELVPARIEPWHLKPETACPVQANEGIYVRKRGPLCLVDRLEKGE